MNHLPSLEGIERKLMRGTLQDGLMDMYVAFMLLPFILFIKTGWAPMAFLPVIMFPVLYPALKWVKRNVVLPRTGSIRPGQAHRRRRRILIVVGTSCVVVTVVLVILTATRSSLHLVFGLFALLCVAGTAAVAWQYDLPRVLLYGVLLAVSIPLDTVNGDRPGWFPLTLVPVLIILGTGIGLLVKFIHENPLPDVGDDRES